MSVISNEEKACAPAADQRGEEERFSVDRDGAEQRTVGHWHIQCKQFAPGCRAVIWAFPLTARLITAFICRSRKVCVNNWVISKTQKAWYLADMVWTVSFSTQCEWTPLRSICLRCFFFLFANCLISERNVQEMLVTQYEIAQFMWTFLFLGGIESHTFSGTSTQLFRSWGLTNYYPFILNWSSKCVKHHGNPPRSFENSPKFFP